jgi:ParB family chromosome partitioning protein
MTIELREQLADETNDNVRVENAPFVKPAKPAGLGRGLAALIGENKSSNFQQADDSQQMVAVGRLSPSKFQPRTEFDTDALDELAKSIGKNGVIQPIIVRNKGENYEIVAGERRWRASQLAGLTSVPVIVRNLEDKEVMEMALVENVQRKDLGALEEAQAYRRLLGEFGYTQDELHKTVGKSRSHIANLLRLLSLPEEVKQMLNDGRLSMGHARALLGCSDPISLANKIAEDGLSVRAAEELAKQDFKKAEAARNRANNGSKRKASKDSDIVAIEQLLTNNLGSAVSIKAKGREGEIKISYKSLEQLDSILQKLGTAA